MKNSATVAAQPRLDTPAETIEGEYILSLKDLFRTVAKRIWLIVLVSTLLVGATVGFTLLQTPMYEASIKILVGQERGLTQNPLEVQGLQQLTRTMSEAVNSRPVIEAVIQQLDLQITSDDFTNRLNVEQIPETQFIQVNYSDSSP